MSFIRIILMAILILSSTTIFASSSDVISVTLQANKQAVSESEVNVLITNTSTKPLKVLKWNTPLEGDLSANIFNVAVDGKPVVYTGKLVKRGAPKDTDYIVFQPSETKSVALDLSSYYKMDKTGMYSVSYKGFIKFSLDGLKKSNSTSQLDLKNKKIDSDTLNLNVSSIKKKIIDAKLAANFDQCTETQQNDLILSHDQAIIISNTAATDMNNATVPTSAPRYSEWFGTADTTRHNTVKDTFNNVHNALDTQQIVFSCECSAVSDPENTYAYVYPDQPYTIHICGAFWNAPLDGTDSKGGTIVHETAHFTVVAGTSDYAYGQTSARALADSNPDQAVMNSDSYEYFAENTPYLDMEETLLPTISGYVTDAATGLPISGALVSLLFDGVTDSTYTDTNGLYSFTNLASGTYSLSTTAEGYTSESSTTIVETNDKVVNFNLLALSISQDYRIVLSWGASPTDLDSHFFVANPTSEGCLDLVYYNDKEELPYASLDVDDTTSYGPETVSIFQFPASGTNEYWVHNFSGSPNMTTSSAKVQVYNGSTLVKTFNITPNVDDSSRYWHVFDISRTGIKVVNELLSSEDATCSKDVSFIVPTIIVPLLLLQ